MSESRITENIPTSISDATNIWKVYFSDGYNVSHLGDVESTTISDPFSLDLSQFITNVPIDLPGLVALTAGLVQDQQDREEIISNRKVRLIEEYQPDPMAEMGDEVITYKLIRREPAKLSRDGKSRPNRGFGSAYEYRNPKEPNKVICIESRPIDHTIEFAVWAKTATLANSRALWLERLITSNRWLYTSKGVNPFYWKERGPDTLWTPSGARLHQRPIQFFARLREHQVLAYPTIREFETDINTQI